MKKLWVSMYDTDPVLASVLLGLSIAILSGLILIIIVIIY